MSFFIRSHRASWDSVFIKLLLLFVFIYFLSLQYSRRTQRAGILGRSSRISVSSPHRRSLTALSYGSLRTDPNSRNSIVSRVDTREANTLGVSSTLVDLNVMDTTVMNSTVVDNTAVDNDGGETTNVLNTTVTDKKQSATNIQTSGCEHKSATLADNMSNNYTP